jgi:hypothetical protein
MRPVSLAGLLLTAVPVNAVVPQAPDPIRPGARWPPGAWSARLPPPRCRRPASSAAPAFSSSR